MREEVYLKNYKDFVKINSAYYGGDQRWLFKKNRISKFWANRSCGLIAVSNTLCYINRYKYPKLTQKDYIDLTMSLYPFVKPKIYGIPTVGAMVKALTKYGKSVNCQLKTFPMIKPTDLTRVVEYIKDALKQNHPVMLLTINSKIKNLRYHWVTITGYYKNNSGQHYIITSNYGFKKTYNLGDWVEEKSIYKGLLWFTIIY